ncbi:P-loop containing nucleoside triphosphate hydrolase protein [Mycena sp. CBHHK59/15]|nr:P-loop containing nucleoside triphosphate hydrolase protein [Mycena sp. CBHHK59/15]
MVYMDQQRVDGYSQILDHAQKRKAAFDKKVTGKSPREVIFKAGWLVQVYRSDLDYTFKTERKTEPKCTRGPGGAMECFHHFQVGVAAVGVALLECQASPWPAVLNLRTVLLENVEFLKAIIHEHATIVLVGKYAHDVLQDFYAFPLRRHLNCCFLLSGVYRGARGNLWDLRSGAWMAESGPGAMLVEDARARYVSINQPHVIIHLADSPPHYGPDLIWNNVKRKTPRPLNSIILPEGVVDALVCDAKEFISTEDWYVEAGIPHRRGYLLYGPSGSGKTSTIYALAGALNLEIYSLSLASRHVDDSFLQRAASLIPKHAIFLIEDIDCAFASRDDEEELEDSPMKIYGAGRPGPLTAAHGARSLVTLSGLLNVIDGVGSEEGNLFFATTNYIDHLDPALLRPGRIDRKIAYELATIDQARALFMRFFLQPGFRTPSRPPMIEDSKPEPDIHGSTDTETLTLAAAFSASIPQAEFTTAELQCYLQGHKTSPVAAVEGAPTWVTEKLGERHARDVREKARNRRTWQQRTQQFTGT